MHVVALSVLVLSGMFLLSGYSMGTVENPLLVGGGRFAWGGGAKRAPPDGQGWSFSAPPPKHNFP